MFYPQRSFGYRAGACACLTIAWGGLLAYGLIAVAGRRPRTVAERGDGDTPFNVAHASRLPCSSLNQTLAATAKCGGKRKRRYGQCELFVLIERSPQRLNRLCPRSQRIGLSQVPSCRETIQP
jgi:hypothetical protein